MDVFNRLASYNTRGTNFDVDSMACVKRTLRECMYAELTHIWSRSCVASVTREIHPRWEKRVLPSSMFSRLSHVRYHCAALNRCPLRKRLALIKRAASSECRYGCNAEEDLKHVLFECPRVRLQRDELMEACDEFGYAKTLKNFFTRRQLQFPVEKLIVQFTDSA